VTDGIPLVSENNTLRRMQFLNACRSPRKVIAEKGLLSPENKDQLGNGVDMEVIEIDKGKIGIYGLEKSIHVMQTPGMNADSFNVARQSQRDFDEIMGQSAAARGTASGGTATEDQHTSQFEKVRYDFDRFLYRGFLVEIVKKLNDSIDANMTIERAIELEGEDGQTFVGLIDRDIIAGDFDIDIDITEMTPTDGPTEAAHMIQFAQVVGQNPMFARNEAVLRTMADRVGIHDEMFIQGLVEEAKKQQEMEAQLMAMKAQPKVPEAGPPQDAAQAIQQTGAGQQMPAMQGAA
jgi:hypothetical protein